MINLFIRNACHRECPTVSLISKKSIYIKIYQENKKPMCLIFFFLFSPITDKPTNFRSWILLAFYLFPCNSHCFQRINQPLYPICFSNDTIWFVKFVFYSICIWHRLSTLEAWFCSLNIFMSCLRLSLLDLSCCCKGQIFCRFCAMSDSPRMSQVSQSISRRAKYQYLGKCIDPPLVYDSKASFYLLYLSLVFLFICLFFHFGLLWDFVYLYMCVCIYHCSYF